MDDAELVRRIGELAAEEQSLHEAAAGPEGLTDQHRGRLHDLEVALDQCWDLLRQRRARRRAGEDPDDAEVRPEEVVERYQQ